MILFHFYADDSQFWKSFNPKSADEIQNAVKHLEHTLNHILEWMRQNKLKVNESKTEFVVMGTKRNREKANIKQLRVGDSIVDSSPAARNLGVTIDESLSFERHITEVVRSCRYFIHELWQIRPYLTLESAKTIVHATIISRLDYCNSLYMNMPLSQTNRLQKVMNEAARLITRTPRNEHITPAMKDLHWLPIKERIQFKVLTIVYKALHGQTPDYIRALLIPNIPSRQLRSCDQKLLLEPRFRLKSAGFRSFEVAAPRIWNVLPLEIRNSQSLPVFKKVLKTHLFVQAYTMKTDF